MNILHMYDVMLQRDLKTAEFTFKAFKIMKTFTRQQDKRNLKNTDRNVTVCIAEEHVKNFSLSVRKGLMFPQEHEHQFS